MAAAWVITLPLETMTGFGTLALALWIVALSLLFHRDWG